MPGKILVADDEAGIVSLLREDLEGRGYLVYTARNGEEALAQAARRPDLILLDICMPGPDGLEVCRRIRDHVSCPIVFLTARVESCDKLAGFGAGADDYIIKPFDLEEVAARSAAHLRREQRRAAPANVRFFGEVAVDYTARTLTAAGTPVPLSRREFDIVALLSAHPGQVFDRERIYELIWSYDGAGNSDTIMEHIRKIRRKLAQHTGQSCIDTVWGCGYRWNA